MKRPTMNVALIANYSHLEIDMIKNNNEQELYTKFVSYLVRKKIYVNSKS